MDFIRTLILGEFRRKARQRFFHTGRVFIVLIFSLMLSFGYMTGSVFNGGTAVGLHVFSKIIPVALLLAAFGASMAAAQTLARERQNRVFSLLLLSDISLGRLLCGRLLATILISLTGIFCALPLIMLSVSLGGIGSAQVLSALLLVFSTICLSSGIGMLSGAWSATPRQAVGLAFVLSLVFFLFTPVVRFPLAVYLDYLLGFQRQVILSPFQAGRAITAGVDLSGPIYYSLFLMLMTLPVCLLAMWTIRRRSRGSATAEGARPVARGTKRRLDCPPIGLLNPVAWHGLYCRMQRRPRHRLPGFALLIVVVIGSGGTAWMAMNHDSESIAATFLFVAGIIAVWVIFSSYWQSCHLFQDEMESGLLELIVCTDLTAKEIVAGKLQSIRLACGSSLVIIALVTLFGLSASVVKVIVDGDFELVLPITLTVITGACVAVGFWLALTGIGLFTGFRYPNHPVLVSIGILMLLYLPISFLGGMIVMVFATLLSLFGSELASAAGLNFDFLLILIPIMVGLTALGLGLLISAIYRQWTVFRLERLRQT